MTKQETMEWLSRYGKSKDRSVCLKEQLDEMLDEASKLTATYGAVGGGKSGGTSHDRIADIVAKQEEIRTLMYDELYQQNTLQMEIKLAIIKVPNPLLRSLLEERYLRRKRWWEIAQRLNHSEDYCKKELFHNAITNMINIAN